MTADDQSLTPRELARFLTGPQWYWVLTQRDNTWRVATVPATHADEGPIDLKVLIDGSSQSYETPEEALAVLREFITVRSNDAVVDILRDEMQRGEQAE